MLEHPYGGSWGYQVTGFFAPTSRHGHPHDFKFFVDACHRAGHRRAARLGARPLSEGRARPRALRRHRALRARGSASGRAPGLGHADLQLRHGTRCGTSCCRARCSGCRSITSTACAWTPSRRCCISITRDQSGQWIPNRYGGRENLEAVSFLQQLNTLTHAEAPGTITVAEESTAWPGVSRPVHLGGLGFTYKWNMGWMHDTLKYMARDPLYRKWAQNEITFSMIYAYTENFILPYSHDEVVHGKRSMLDKMPGDAWQKAANLRALYAFMYAHPGKKLLFMGDEFGQWREWNREGQPRLGSARAAAAPGPRVARRRSQSDSTPASRRSSSAISICRASGGSTPATTRTASSRSCRCGAESEAIVACVFNWTPVCAITIASACRRRANGEVRLNTDDRGLRRLWRGQRRARSRPSRSPRTGSSSRSRSRCRRSARCGCRRADDRRGRTRSCHRALARAATSVLHSTPEGRPYRTSPRSHRPRFRHRSWDEILLSRDEPFGPRDEGVTVQGRRAAKSLSDHKFSP